jgi:hypothetical protein
MATTAGHFAIQTPRSEAQTINSINADEITFGSQEASFQSPSKQKNHGSQKFLSRLTKPTTPLGEIKNNARPTRVAGKNEFTPLLKSVTKNQFMKRGLASQTPSRLRHVMIKSASTSDLPEMTDEGFSVVAEESVSPSEKDLAEMSSASVSFQKLPARSPGSNEGAAILTLREQEKVHSTQEKTNIDYR